MKHVIIRLTSLLFGLLFYFAIFNEALVTTSSCSVEWEKERD